MPKTLVLATHNAHKTREINQILGPDFQILTLTDIGCHEEIPETAETLEGNAQLKARHVREHYGHDCFSEDTGLEVKALAGAPGVHTARYAGEAKDPAANMDLLLKNLADKPTRRAQFRTVICLIFNGKEHLFEGVCPGEIAAERQGEGGFGYDPIFRPEGHTTTFAEMSDEAKNAISHRGQATRKMVAWLGEQD